MDDLRTTIVKYWNLLNLYLLIYLSGDFVKYYYKGVQLSRMPIVTLSIIVP